MEVVLVEGLSLFFTFFLSLIMIENYRNVVPKGILKIGLFTLLCFTGGKRGKGFQ